MAVLAGVAAQAIALGTISRMDEKNVNTQTAVNNIAAFHSETDKLQKRGCYIACPRDRAFCYYPPHNYRCDRHGGLRYDERDLDCEHTTDGCYCSCDFWAPGIDKIPKDPETEKEG
ncbi:hypothetical protein CCHL11_00258 [Colletotrichum chlorophyti]|uniref:Uncharacterized protein n=1 Tax=Colletotrichum chlorophyti TaxID=708187 RepID=A0A1Q8RUE9_9PEZI|nr:hypothetical protein CCHL11_00258 [Colletotrichum chlorophyti]